MESSSSRRSRGRPHKSQPLGDQVASTSKATTKSTPSSTSPSSSSAGIQSSGATDLDMNIVEAPEVGVEEVVLNRRGMPARERKRNRLYYDDNQMITSDSQLRLTKQLNKSPSSFNKKVKKEPIEVEEQGIVIQDDPFAFQSTSIEVDKEVEAGELTTEQVEQAEEDDGSYEEYERVYDEEEDQSSEGQEIDNLLMPPPPTPTSASRSKKSVTFGEATILGPPTAAQVAQAVTTMVNKPRSGRVSTSSASAEQITIKTEKVSKKKDKKERAEKSKSPTVKPLKVRLVSGETLAQTMSFKAKADVGPTDSMAVMDQDNVPPYERVSDKKNRHPNEQRHKSQDPLRAHRRSLSTYNNTNRVLEDPLLRARTGLDKKSAHDISIRLRNLLKLPKAHKWVCYEWFYSNIDKVLFDGENDFQTCLKECFPNLRAGKLAHAEWTKVRRMMGKPRRCSKAFFDEEREELQCRRHKIRMIQQRKITDFNYKELPDEIPLQLVIGSKVTGRLRKPQDGLFTGTIEAVDTSNNTYRITFDRSGLGTHSIPDYEVLSNEPPETVATSSFALRKNYGRSAGTQFKISNELANEMSGFPKSPFPADGFLGGFPIRLLDMIVRFSKLLKAKREKILLLKELNVEAEKEISYGRSLTEDYRIRYSRCVLDLCSVNKEMELYQEAIQQYCIDIVPDPGSNQMIVPETVQEQCRQEALLIVDTYNIKQNRNLVHGRRPLTLIANLTSLMLQVKALSNPNGDRNLYELKSVKDTMKEIKPSLDGKNIQLFQNLVEIPFNRILAGLSVNSR